MAALKVQFGRLLSLIPKLSGWPDLPTQAVGIGGAGSETQRLHIVTLNEITQTGDV